MFSAWLVATSDSHPPRVEVFGLNDGYGVACCNVETPIRSESQVFGLNLGRHPKRMGLAGWVGTHQWTAIRKGARMRRCSCSAVGGRGQHGRQTVRVA